MRLGSPLKRNMTIFLVSVVIHKAKDVGKGIIMIVSDQMVKFTGEHDSMKHLTEIFWIAVLYTSSCTF